MAEGHVGDHAGVGAEGGGEFDAEQLLDEGRVGALRVGGDVGAADEQVGAGFRLAAQGVLQRGGEDREAFGHGAAPAGRAALLAADQVDDVGRDGIGDERVARHGVEGVAEAHQGLSVAVGIIEGVAGDNLAGVVVAGGAEARVLVVHIERGAAEFVVLADVADFADVGYARVQTALEAGEAGALHPGGGGDAVEVVDDQHGGVLGPVRDAHGKDLGREALAAGVEGFHLVAVDVARLDVERDGGLLSLHAGVEGAVIDARVDDVAVGRGRGLLGIGGGLPFQPRVAAVLEPDGEGLRRQRLHDVGGVVELAERLEDAFVDGPAYRETEGRVEAVFHVGEVLVAQQLQDHGRHAGGAGLAVAAVPEAAARPLGVVVEAQVLDDLGLDVVAEHAADDAVAAVLEFALAVVAQRVDGQRADGAVVGREPGVGVEGEGEVDGDVLLLAHHRGPCAAGGVVAGVVGLPGAGEGAVGAGPLHPVVGAFGGCRHAGGAAAALELAHAAAELDGVGGDDEVGAAAVVEHHAAFRALGEFEGAEVDPGAAAAPLVHDVFRLPAEVVDGVVGFGAAVGAGLIGDVHGVAAALLDVGGPGGAGRGLGAAALRLARRAGAEGMVGEGVHGLGVGEAFAGAGPGAVLVVAAPGAHQALAGAAESRVVVGDDFPDLGVPLARRHHVGAGVLQHRDEEGEHVGLGVHVLDGAVDGGALPDPFVRLLVVVAAVALPDHDVAVVEALEPTAAVHALDEARLDLPRVVGLEGVVGGGLAVGAEHRGGEFLEFVFVGDDLAGGVVLPGPFLLQLLAEPGHVRFVPGEVGKVVVEGEVELLAAGLHLADGQAVVDGGAALEPGGEGVAEGAEFTGAGLPGEGKDGEQGRQEEDEAAGMGHLALRILETSMMKVRVPARPMATQSA